MSYRASDGVATIGCAWDQDVAGWLRREMQAPPLLASDPAVSDAVGSPRVPRAVARPHAPRPVAPQTRRGALGRISLIFVAAFGLGVALSAYDRG